MLPLLSKWVILAFGALIIAIGLLMLFKPERARWLLRQAASTNLINYAEITVRLIPATALIWYADLATYPLPFKALGWIMLITSLLLYTIPRAWHQKFSLTGAEILTPLRFQLVAPFAFLFGGLMIWNVW